VVFQPGRIGTARIGVLTPLPEEFVAAKHALRADLEIPDSGYYTPDRNLLDVVLTQGDRGNAAAVDATSNLIEDFRPEVILLVGIAGGFRDRSEKIEPGDVVVPDYLHYAAFRSIKAKKGDMSRHEPHDPPAHSLHQRFVRPTINEGVWQSSVRSRPPDGKHQPRVFVAPLVAGECVLGDPDNPEQRRVLSSPEYSDALAVDMESMGVAMEVHRKRNSPVYNPRLLVVRGISDPVWSTATDVSDVSNAAAREPLPSEEDPNETRVTWKIYAADVAAAFAAALVVRLLRTPDPRPFLQYAASFAKNGPGPDPSGLEAGHE
jgi:nucleoside phosphorylase